MLRRMDTSLWLVHWLVTVMFSVTDDRCWIKNFFLGSSKWDKWCPKVSQEQKSQLDLPKAEGRRFSPCSLHFTVLLCPWTRLFTHLASTLYWFKRVQNVLIALYCSYAFVLMHLGRVLLIYCGRMLLFRRSSKTPARSPSFIHQPSLRPWQRFNAALSALMDYSRATLGGGPFLTPLHRKQVISPRRESFCCVR